MLDFGTDLVLTDSTDLGDLYFMHIDLNFIFCLCCKLSGAGLSPTVCNYRILKPEL